MSNDPHLAKITSAGNFSAKVGAVLESLKANSEDGRIFESIRTIEQQREKVRLGYSKTLASKHLPGKDGKARAADIADRKLGWNASKRFWLIIGGNCEARGIAWGGLFGLSVAQRRAVVAAIGTLRKAGWPKQHEAYQVRIGWDPAHLETGPSNWPA